MLTVEESSKLFSLLNAVHRPFGEIVADFFSMFPSSTFRFRFCFALATLLEDPPMLSSSQRMVAICMLHQSYASQQPSANPFISVLLDVACDERFESYERGVVFHLLGACCPGTSKELLEQSAAEYVMGFQFRAHHFTHRQKLEGYFGSKAVSEPHNFLFKDHAVKNIIPDPDIPHQCDASFPEFNAQPGSDPKLGSGDRDEAIVQLLQNLSIPGIEPQWIRPHPPRLPVLEGELVWLSPQGSHELLWDYGMCADISREATLRNLAAKALKKTLNPAEQEQLLKELANDPKMVRHCGLTSSKLQELVEKNPPIAVQLLIKFINSPEIRDYYFVLEHMDLSLQSMEVVGQLSTSVGLPKGVVHSYIRNCLSSCQKIRDKQAQNRVVRIVCVFVQSLIKRKVLNVADLFIEIQAFCIEFSRIREAAALFRILKAP